MGRVWTEGHEREYDRRMSNTIERQFNKIMRDQAIYEGEQERGSIDWGIALVWIATLIVGALFAVIFATTAWYLINLTWGEVAEWASAAHE